MYARRFLLHRNYESEWNPAGHISILRMEVFCSILIYIKPISWCAGNAYSYATAYFNRRCNRQRTDRATANSPRNERHNTGRICKRSCSDDRADKSDSINIPERYICCISIQSHTDSTGKQIWLSIRRHCATAGRNSAGNFLVAVHCS